ncbi:hypothetical protein ACFQ1E_11655 [Sphingomonas canadensis]|uniref:Tetratricopeptide repeat protein n=1 Tax=Sphingomonas canadensis TaxID=1219257 RepID=A0ABW3H6V5_9SPHN|nr:hypothetical protein [Sphingomonas canadensis]MCW3836871.1 hypothetical protein [Sphingomonas canadensis]
MKKLMMVALASAISIGVVMPASAQKEDKKAKEKAPKETPLQVGDKFRKVAGDADKAITDKKYDVAAAKIGEAEALIKNDDEKYYWADMLLRLSLGNNDNVAQMRAIDVLVASPRTPPERARVLSAHRAMGAANDAYNAKKYAEAIPLLLKARELGRTDIDISVMLANSYSNTGKNSEAVVELEKAIADSKAAGQKAPESWYKFAITRVNAAGDPSATAGWLLRYLTDYPTVANWRWGTVVYRDAVKRNGSFDNLSRLGLFRLMRTTGALADQQDYFDYVKAALELGLPFEAQAVIKEGETSGKIPSDASAFVQLKATAASGVRAESPIEELVKGAQAAKNGKEAASAGDVLIGLGNYARAVELYDLALSKGGVATETVTFNRAVALMLAGRKADARPGFAAVSTKPLADVARYWLTYIDLPAALAQ